MNYKEVIEKLDELVERYPEFDFEKAEKPSISSYGSREAWNEALDELYKACEDKQKAISDLEERVDKACSNVDKKGNVLTVDAKHFLEIDLQFAVGNISLDDWFKNFIK